MASNHTENYGLSQWEKTDKVLMEDFNEDNAKIDAAIKAAEGRVDDLAGTVSGCSSALGRKGNCQIYVTTYTGNEQFGASNPTRLTFPGRPLLVFSFGGRTLDFVVLFGNSNGMSVGNVTGDVTVSWGSNSVSWYSTQSAAVQHNARYSYQVVALLAMD